MRKLKLNLEALQVDSFEPDSAPSAKPGTVRGREVDCSAYDTCWCPTGEARCTATVPLTDYSCQSNIIACPVLYSDGSCDGSCYYSDAHSCTWCNTEDRTCWYC
ncbi:MAG TPA: hypothetical protein VF771_20865 [Longimicrobiaceae bacterium]